MNTPLPGRYPERERTRELSEARVELYCTSALKAMAGENIYVVRVLTRRIVQSCATPIAPLLLHDDLDVAPIFEGGCPNAAELTAVFTYSARSATTGSTRDARRAGTKLATAATRMTRRIAIVSVHGSRALN